MSCEVAGGPFKEECKDLKKDATQGKDIGLLRIMMLMSV
jgi:hypothetical protein